MRDLVELYFKESSIVNHHIASFNDFLSSQSNPNSRMQKIVDNLRVSADDTTRGIIKLEQDRTERLALIARVGQGIAVILERV